MAVSAVGIDLGTTFSSVSVYKKGKAETIANEYSERLVPSVVYFDKNTGDVYVGKEAEYLIPNCVSNGLFDAKRLIGRRFDDEYVTKYRNSNKLPFEIVEGPNKMAAFQIEISGEKVMKTPEEISAEILKYIKTYASVYLGRQVKEAVISVPAYFSNSQRKATKKAAELAGLKVIKLVTEPTAAAINYIHEKDIKEKKILVFDFGGGTLDVSIINKGNQDFQVKAVRGHSFLGGRNLDEILLNHFLNEFLKAHKLSSKRESIVIRRLREISVTIKKILSNNHTARCFIENYDGNDNDFECNMERIDFERLCMHVFEEALATVELCLKDAGFSKSDIDVVVLVGGTTRIPKVKELLVKHFDYFNNIMMDLNVDEVVGLGASIQAHCIKENSMELEKYKVTEVTPLSLGLKGQGDLMTVLINKNSALPKNATVTRVTVANDQKSVVFEIYEGERANVKYNNLLGKFTIENLPLRRAGDVEFTVKFDLDEDGILTVSATEDSTGKEEKLSITMGEFRLSERKIKISIEQAEKNKSEDLMFEEFVLLCNSLQRKCNHIVYDLTSIPSKEAQEFVKEKCNEFINISDGLDYKEQTKLTKEFNDLKTKISDKFKDIDLLHVFERLSF